MTFQDNLNNYLTVLGCTAKELSLLCGVSEATISRYRSGARIPEYGSDILRSIACGISSAAEKRNIPCSFEDVYNDMNNSLPHPDCSKDTVIRNFGTLVGKMHINLTDLADFLNYNPSYISRISLQQRKPADVKGFLEGVCDFVSRRVSDRNDLEILAGLTGFSVGELQDQNLCARILNEWMRREH